MQSYGQKGHKVRVMEDKRVARLTGTRIRRAREAASMTQDELGGWLGCSGGRISDLERGAPAGSALRASEIRALVEIFGIEAGYWIGEQAEEPAAVVEVRNLTGISVNVYARSGADWQLVREYPPDGEIVRYHNKWVTRYTLEGVEVRLHAYEASNVPEPEPGVLFIVHPNVCLALPHRADMVAAEFRSSNVRKPGGKAYGVEYLTVYSEDDA